MDNADFCNTYEQYRDFIRQIKNGAAKTLWDDAIREICRDQIRIGTEYGISESNRYWMRARVHSGLDGSDPYVGKEIDVNPNSKRNRCNKDNVGLLYIAKDIDTCLSEVQAGARDLVSIGYFEIRKDIHLVDITDAIMSNSNRKYNGLTAEQAMYFLLLISHNEFKKQGSEEVYIITSYVSDLFLQAGADGIRYRSVKFSEEEGRDQDFHKRDCIAMLNDNQKNAQWIYTKQIKLDEEQNNGNKFKYSIRQ